MLFSSPEFVLGFLPALLAIYACVRPFGRTQTAQLLLAASVFFYGWWNPWGVLLLAGSITFNWLVSRRLGQGHHGRGALLAFGIAANIAVLAFFKYSNFFIANVNELSGANWPLLNIILPLGISFITFQKIAFLVDSYSGDTSKYRFQEFALFVAFFPQLIAGPIVHHAEMLAQFHKPDAFRLRASNFTVGLTAFSIGLVKKVVIADTFASFADPVFGAAGAGLPPPMYEAWIAALAFTLQVYFDFSGYSDMALGLARMFGIRLPLNFNSPYKAQNIIDYWQRWHITLSRFLTDYIYTPLSIAFMRQSLMAGQGRAPIFAKAVVVPLFAVFIVSGVWHGSGWNFVVWGLMHFFAMAIARGWRELKLPNLPFGVSWVLTMSFIVASLVVFRAENMNAALTMFEAMAFGAPGLAYFESPRRVALLIAAGFAFCLLLPNTAELLARYNPVIDRKMPRWSPSFLPKGLVWRPTLAWATAVSLMFTIALTFVLQTDEAREFIYFQF